MGDNSYRKPRCTATKGDHAEVYTWRRAYRSTFARGGVKVTVDDAVCEKVVEALRDAALTDRPGTGKIS